MQNEKQLLILLIDNGASNQADLIHALNDGALLASLGVDNQTLVEGAHDIALDLAHGMICKQCGHASPYGVGYAAYGLAASIASYGLTRCECNHSVLAGGV